MTITIGTVTFDRVDYDAEHSRGVVRSPRMESSPACPAVPALDALVLLDHERTRADEAHLAFEDVQELRQLIQRTLAQEPPYPRNAGVVGDLEHLCPLCPICPQMAGVPVRLVVPSCP
jgi:hypothetical protein